METSSSRIYGYIGAGSFALIVILILVFFTMPVPTPVRTPPEGIDVLTTIQTLGGGMPSGGNTDASNTPVTSGGTSSDVLSTDHTSNHTTAPNHNSNNNSNTNNWGDAWSNSQNTSNTSNNNNGGNGGDGPGGEGNGGRGNCKGCHGSGSFLGNGDATHIPVPNINNRDEGTIVVKIWVKPNGTVDHVQSHGNKGTTADLSEDSYRKVEDAAMHTTFKPEAGITELRIAYISYKLRPN